MAAPGGIALFALSYDPVPVLAAFADEHGIAYDLLSDEGSVVLERLGLLNRHVEAQQRFHERGVEERHERLPYPGTIVLDEAGTVVERLFEQSFRPRPNAGSVLRRAGGALPAGHSVTAGDGVVTVCSPPRLPAGRPFRVEGLDEEFSVLDGTVRVTVPFRLPGSRYLPDGRNRPDPGPSRPVTLELLVGYQACSDVECLPPARQRLTLTLDEEGLATPR